MALLETLIDPATSLPDYAVKWAGTTATMQGVITNSGGAHHIPPAASGTAFREIKTAFGDYIIDGSYVAVEISGLPTGAGEAWVRIYLNGSGALTSKAYVHWLLGSTISFGHDNAGVSQGSTSLTYSASTHRWVAIVHRETGGNGTFDWYTAQTPTAAPPTNGAAGPTNGWTRRWTDAAGLNPGASQQLSIFQINDSTAAANVGNMDVAGVNTGWEAVVSAPVNTVAPAITGTVTTGNTLTCSTGTWSNTPTSFAYQWTRDGASIGSATSSTYTIVLADEGHTLACTVTATNAGGSSSVASNSVSPGVTPPANTAAPVVTGTATTGSTLTVSNGTWSGSPTFARQWKRNGTAISGATGTTYVLQVADEGTSVKATVTATNAGGSVSADSNAVSPTAANTAPTNTVPPALSGTPQTGQTLQCSTGTWAGSPDPIFAYQWKRGSTIIGTNANQYTLTVAEVGQSVKCTVTATNPTGGAGSGVVPGPQTVSTATQGTVTDLAAGGNIATALSSMTAGNTLRLANGSYAGFTTSKAVTGGTIRIVPAAGATVTIGTGQTTLSGAANLDFRGITWTGTVRMDTGTNACSIRGGSSTATGTGIDFRDTADNNFAEDITITGANSSFNFNAASEAAAGEGNTIRRCKSVNVVQDHVIISRGLSVTIEDCEFFGHTDTAQHSDGVQVVGGKDILVRRCWIHNTRAFRDAATDRNDHGVIANYDPSDGTGRVAERIKVENCLIHDMTSTGIAIAGCLGIEIVNNTVYDNGSGGSAAALNITPDPLPSITGLRVINNALSSRAQSGTISYATSQAADDLNNFVADGSGPSGGTNRTTGSPGFVDSANADYTLTSGSSLRGSGTATSQPSTDVYGLARATPPSRGAIEGTLTGTGPLSGSADSNTVIPTAVPTGSRERIGIDMGFP